MMLHDMPAVMWSFLSMQGKSTDEVRVLSHPTPQCLGSGALSQGFCVKYDSKPNSRATRYRYWLKHDRHGGQDPRKIKYIDDWHTRSGADYEQKKSEEKAVRWMSEAMVLKMFNGTCTCCLLISRHVVMTHWSQDHSVWWYK